MVLSGSEHTDISASSTALVASYNMPATERMIGSDERRPTLLYNGYGDYVAHLYET